MQRGRNPVQHVPSPLVDVDRLDTGHTPEIGVRADTVAGVMCTDRRNNLIVIVIERKILELLLHEALKK